MTYCRDGQSIELFTIGHLADALERSPETIRRWERAGILPRPRYRRRSTSHRGERRLYSAGQIRLINYAAQEARLGDYRANRESLEQFKAARAAALSGDLA